jgi:hypothetical protein
MGGWYHGRIKGISNSKPTGLVSPWETWIMGNNPTGWVLSGGIPADYVGFIAVAVCDQLSSQIIWTYQCVNLTDYDAASDSSFDNTILHGQFSYLESLNTFVYWDSTIDITTSLSNTGWFPISFALANSVAGNIFMIQLKDFIGISPTNAYVPAWNTVANKFVLVPNGTGSGVTKLIQLTDCNVDELVGSDQKFLKWDFGTTKWIASLVPLTSIDPAGASNGQTIVLSGGVWTHELLPITSINPTGATPGQVLSYTGGVITWITNSAGVTTFAGLSDVSVTDGAGSLNKFVYWNGSFWVAGLVPIASINPAGSAAGQVLTSAGPSSPPVWAASAAVALQVVSYNAVGGASIYNNGWGTGPHYACPSGSAFVQVTCQITWTNSGGTGPVTISLARVNSGGAGYGDYAFYEAVTAVSGASTLFQGSKMMPVNPGDYFVLVGTTGAGYLAVASAYVQIVRLG